MKQDFKVQNEILNERALRDEWNVAEFRVSAVDLHDWRRGRIAVELDEHFTSG